MALPILDGNQSATTLSTIVTGGQHIPAHTVISLGSQAISDITSAVSGVQISGSVNVSGTNFDGDGNLLVTLQPGAAPYTQPISGSVTISALPEGIIFGQQLAEGYENYGGLTIQNLPLISGTVTVGNSITIGASSVTLNSNVAKRDDGTWTNLGVETGSGYIKARVYPSDVAPFTATVTVGNSVTISGAVTANLPINGAYGGTFQGYNGTNTYLNVGIQNVGATSLNGASGLPISMPGGLFTTRFSSVVTANVPQLTQAVTNSLRKYLLIQNVGSSTITIGIGFSPTTTQGIALYSGGGLTFDSFVPTGAVYWLSSVTGSNIIVIDG
jgi:hypothetical protein